MEDSLRILVIYRRPPGFPGGYVVRGHCVHHDGRIVPEKGGMVFTAPESPEGDAQCLAAARRHCAALGLCQLQRSAGDAPEIVETWL